MNEKPGDDDGEWSHDNSLLRPNVKRLLTSLINAAKRDIENKTAYA